MVVVDLCGVPAHRSTRIIGKFEGEIDESVGKPYNDAAWTNVLSATTSTSIPQDQAPIAAWRRTGILERYGPDIPTT